MLRVIFLFSEAIIINYHAVDVAKLNRGVAYYQSGQYELAIRDYDKVIELNPNDDVAYNNRVVAYSALGQYERAIQDYNKVIELNPDYAEAYNNRGLAYELLGNMTSANADFAKAQQLGYNGCRLANLGKKIPQHSQLSIGEYFFG